MSCTSHNYDSSIAIEARTATVDSVGAPTESWATLATARAQKRYLSARENIAAGRLNADTTAEIIVRYHSALSVVRAGSHRVNHSGVIGEILEVHPMPVERTRNLRIIVREERNT